MISFIVLPTSVLCTNSVVILTLCFLLIQWLDTYELTGVLLGTGAASVVKECKNKFDESLCAVKIIAKNHRMANREQVRNFSSQSIQICRYSTTDCPWRMYHRFPFLDAFSQLLALPMLFQPSLTCKRYPSTLVSMVVFYVLFVPYMLDLPRSWAVAQMQG